MRHHREDRERHERRYCSGKHDLPDDRELGHPVHSCRVHEIVGDGCEELAHQEDPEHRYRPRDDEGRVRVREPELGEHDVDRKRDRVHRDEQTEHHHREDELSPPEPELRQGVRAGQGDQHLDEEDRDRHHHAVEQVAQQWRLRERAFVVEYDWTHHAFVLGVSERDAILVDHQLLAAHESAFVALDLARALQRVAQHYVKRQQHDERADDQHRLLQCL